MAGESQPARRRHRRILRWSTAMCGMMYEETRGSLGGYLQALMQDVVLHTDHEYRSTVTAQDVTRALRRRGRTLYGFDCRMD
ncbi:hypothetical protein B0H10DRAFT_2093653 [Mycena sp. CBHHK59/15]|nr:hypothetical protein B0H10DRAFT_2093653 [Mycena sp. CBHHK59/15]